MGQGLGKNSPVVLSLGKDNYEALIDRHGQWMRWRSAQTCPCVKLPSMQPDIHCPICSGRGVSFTYQKDIVVYCQVMVIDGSKFITLEEEYKEDYLVKVYDNKGNTYDNATKLGIYLYLNSANVPEKGSYLTVVFKRNLEKIKPYTTAEKDNSGYYIVPGLKSIRTNIEGIYYDAPADIVSIEEITDSAGEVYTAEEYRLDKFRILPKTRTVEGEEVEIPITEPVFVKNVKYIPPCIFVFLNQNLSKADMQAVVDNQGEGIVSFPYSYDVSQEDILTVLTGTITKKETCPRSAFETDTLGAYFVKEVVSCSRVINNQLVELKEGIDFILVGTNKIKWLDTAIIPDEGDAYSITYHVYPTYKVAKDIPQLRTSEDQRFPKKAVVKIYTTYSEKLGVNKQSVGRFGISGTL